MSLIQELPDLDLETLLIAHGYTGEQAKQIVQGQWSSRHEVPLATAIEKYLKTGLAAPTLSAKTYRNIILQFRSWLMAQWQDVPEEAWTLDRIRRSDIERFANRPKDHGGSRGANTIGKEIAAISTMFNWLIDEKLTDVNPAAKAHRPDKPRPLPVALTEEEQQYLLDLSRRTACGLRNHTIITVALNTGLRASEICRLTKSDLDLDGNTFRVIRSKRQGNPEQILPLLPVVVDVLRYYLQVTSNRVAAPGYQDYVFLNEKGKNWGQAITVDGLETMMRPLLTKLGKGSGCNFHVLRHSYAMNLLRRGMHLIVIQELLGHATVETTRTYLRLHNDELAKALAAAFPEGVLVPGTARDPVNTDLTKKLNELL